MLASQPEREVRNTSAIFSSLKTRNRCVMVRPLEDNYSQLFYCT